MRTLWLLAGLFAYGSAAAAEVDVTFASLASPAIQIPATLQRPDGAGPFPAVVVVHDCSGLGSVSSHAPARWAAELVPQGYVVIIPDSFTPRGLPGGVCTEPAARSRVANGYVRAADAYGALAYLRTLPYVDGERVGIMGGSHGGWTTLAAMYEPVDTKNPQFEVKRHGFAAGIALYPSCGAPYGSWATQRASGDTGPPIGHSGVYKPIAPLLILVGEKDDWTPAQPCEWLADVARQRGYPVEIKVYAGAYHSFDSNAAMRYVKERTNSNMPGGHGATTGGDPPAWADAKLRVRDFLARYLKKTQD